MKPAAFWRKDLPSSSLQRELSRGADKGKNLEGHVTMFTWIQEKRLDKSHGLENCLENYTMRYESRKENNLVRNPGDEAAVLTNRMLLCT